MALLLFPQNLSGAIFVSVGSTIIRNKLLSGLRGYQFTGIDVRCLINAAATDIRELVNENQLKPLLELYNSALRDVFIMAVPLILLALLFALPMEWKSLKKKDNHTPAG
jgi:hypothetical protein